MFTVVEILEAEVVVVEPLEGVLVGLELPGKGVLEAGEDVPFVFVDLLLVLGAEVGGAVLALDFFGD